ncbi:OPT/YSL family transporter [Lacticaseibacillus baoqingensis]|uniref:OPT/YSL family transporter n=1 Tax=Lacticaseibacillus baoqingensis TaxID=2486013 RepID=A0ABW4E409_9LACO|nr:OPT/YSL family transporter [Lacticaseibacillus baoqingensis]
MLGKPRQKRGIVLLIGSVLALIFAASTAYSGMKAGLTVAAGIPGAIIGSGLVQLWAAPQGMRGKNLIQAMASGGESIASGMIYVVPAIILIGGRVNFWAGCAVGAAAVVFAVSVAGLVEDFMVISQAKQLPYPESQAIASALTASEAASDQLGVMAWGFGIGGLVTALSTQVLGWVNTTITVVGDASYRWKFALEVNPMLIGIGFVVGMEVSLTMFAGSLLANFGLTPLIAYFTQFADPQAQVWNAATPIAQLDVDAVAGAYAKYIGAGMMLCGGVIGALKLIPVIRTSLQQTIGSGPAAGSQHFLGRLGGALAVVVITGWLVSGHLGLSLLAAVLAAGLALLFVIVSARMAGTIGCSNAPVSGMTIASLVIMTAVFVLCGWRDGQHTQWLLLFGIFIVTAISVGGAYTQTQKVGVLVRIDRHVVRPYFILAALIGVIIVMATTSLLAPQLAIGGANPPFGLPQANLIATLTAGIMSGKLPWAMVIVGIVLGLVCWLLKLPIMTVALGFYLPMATTSAILVGALLRALVMKVSAAGVRDTRVGLGVSLASGLIAGGSLVGLIGIGLQVAAIVTPGRPSGDLPAWVMLIGLCAAIIGPLLQVRRVAAHNGKDKR